jgi:hypothetical protein
MTTTFDELAAAYLRYARDNKPAWDRDAMGIRKLGEALSGKRVTETSASAAERYKAWRMSTQTIHGRHLGAAAVNRELAYLKEIWNVACQGLIDLT